MLDLDDIIDDVTRHMGGTGNEVTATEEIEAHSGGYDSRTQRIVKENATQLGFEFHEFETWPCRPASYGGVIPIQPPLLLLNL